MTITQLQQSMTSKELSEWMAYDLTQDKDWSKSYRNEQERLQSKQMTDEQRREAFKQLLGAK